MPNDIVPAKRKSGFQKGHRLSVGNKGKASPTSIYRHRKFFSQALISRLHEVDKKTGKMLFEQIINSWVDKAKEGDTYTINSMVDRIEGKPVQVIEADGFGEYESVRIEHVIVKARDND